MRLRRDIVCLVVVCALCVLLAGCATQVPDLSAQIPGRAITFGVTINGRTPQIDHHFKREGKFTYMWWQIQTTKNFSLAPLLVQEMGDKPGIIRLRLKEHATFWQAVARELTLWIYEPRTVTVEGDVIKAIP